MMMMTSQHFLFAKTTLRTNLSVISLKIYTKGSSINYVTVLRRRGSSNDYMIKSVTMGWGGGTGVQNCPKLREVIFARPIPKMY